MTLQYWLLTSTTCGTWLPGDPRGSVTTVREGPVRRRHNVPGTPYDGPMPGLERSARQNLKGGPVYLNRDQANALLPQFRETAQVRAWELEAVAIMRSHVHLVAGAPADVDGERLLKDFKAYGSRALNRQWRRPRSGTWWTESGSRRKLPNGGAVRAAVLYVIRQGNPLLIWVAERWRSELALDSERPTSGR